MLGQELRRCERQYGEAGTTTATHRRKCYSGRALTMRFVMLSLGSLFHSIRLLHARCTAHSPCPIQTRLVLSLCLARPCIGCMAQAIKILSPVVAWKKGCRSDYLDTEIRTLRNRTNTLESIAESGNYSQFWEVGRRTCLM